MSRLCDLCQEKAVWVRCTQFAGDHYFCKAHAEVQPDYMKSDPSSFYWARAEDRIRYLNDLKILKEKSTQKTMDSRARCLIKDCSNRVCLPSRFCPYCITKFNIGRA